MVAISHLEKEGNILKLKSFDVISSLFFLEQVESPVKLLKNMSKLLKKNGLLLLSSSYSWNSKIIPQKNWPGGKTIKGIESYSRSAIEKILESDFYQEAIIPDVPYVIRKNLRDYSYCKADIMLWERK